MTDLWEPFGDIEPEDLYDPTEPPEPGQVAHRLHDLREYLDAVHGTGALPRWEDLEPQEQTLAVAVGDVIVRHLLDTDPDDAETAARQLHNVRRYWASSSLPRWEELAPDERQVGTDLMGHIIDWLKSEGGI